MVTLAKASDVIVSNTVYHDDTLYNLYASHIKTEEKVMQVNNFTKHYQLFPIEEMYDFMKDNTIVSIVLAGNHEIVVEKAKEKNIISQQVIILQEFQEGMMTYQIVSLIISMIIMIHVTHIIRGSKKRAVQKIHGIELRKRMWSGFLKEYIKTLCLLTIVSLSYLLLLYYCRAVESFSVYFNFILVTSFILLAISIATYVAIERLNVIKALKNEQPKRLLFIGVVAYKVILSILTIALFVSLGVRIQTALDDIDGMKIYSQLQNYEAIDYGSNLRIENMFGAQYTDKVYPLLNQMGAVYFDGNQLSVQLEMIRSGKMAPSKLENTVENKVFQINNNYLKQMVKIDNMQKYLTADKEKQIKVIAPLKDQEDLKIYEENHAKICEMLLVKDQKQCEQYDIQFVYYNGEIDAIIPHPFLIKAPDKMIKYPVFINFSEQANIDLGIAKLISSDGFLDPIRVPKDGLTDENRKMLAQYMEVGKVELRSASNGYEQVLRQSRQNLQSTVIEFILFFITVILLSIVMMRLYIEEMKKKLMLQKLAGNSWYTRYQKMMLLILISWFFGFLVKLYFPYENIFFNIHEQSYSGIFWIGILGIAITEVLVLVGMIRLQEHKAIASILKNE